MKTATNVVAFVQAMVWDDAGLDGGLRDGFQIVGRGDHRAGSQFIDSGVVDLQRPIDGRKIMMPILTDGGYDVRAEHTHLGTRQG